jgi:hypothetical protein
MFLEMPFVLRHPVSVLVVLLAFVATAGVFLFARPEYHRQYESKEIDFSKQHYISPDTVQAAFARHGIRLRTGRAFAVTVFNLPGEFQADDLQVLVGPRSGKGSFGPKLESYDERFENVAVTYGGRDGELLDRIKAAVDDLD